VYLFSEIVGTAFLTSVEVQLLLLPKRNGYYLNKTRLKMRRLSCMLKQVRLYNSLPNAVMRRATFIDFQRNVITFLNRISYRAPQLGDTFHSFKEALSPMNGVSFPHSL